MENSSTEKPIYIDAEFEIKLFQKWGMNSYKIDSIINSWRHKQKYSAEYNKIRVAKKQKTDSSPSPAEGTSGDENCSQSPPKAPQPLLKESPKPTKRKIDSCPPAILFQVN